jgi:heme exporter protein D
MSWTSLSDFLNMGGYWLYVWGSYAVTLSAVAVEALLLSRRERTAVRRLRREFARKPAR